MDCVKEPATLGYNLFEASGGPEHALLQLIEGVYFVKLLVSQYGKPDDRHIIIYDAGFCSAQHPQVLGAVIDNSKSTGIKLITNEDRQMVLDANGDPAYPARLVFASASSSLFPFASRVCIRNAWRMQIFSL